MFIFYAKMFLPAEIRELRASTPKRIRKKIILFSLKDIDKIPEE